MADLSAMEQDRRVAAVSNLFTVGLVVRYVAWKLGQPVPNATGTISVANSEPRAKSGVEVHRSEFNHP